MRTKSPMDMHLQLNRIARNLRKYEVYKPYTAYLIESKVHDIICRYIDNMRKHGIDIDNSRHTQIERKVYAGY